MLIKNVYKPKYKSLIYFKGEYLFNIDKILKFKRKKWLNSVLFNRLKNKIKSNRFFKIFDHSLYHRSKANFFYKKRFKHNLLFKKKLCKLLGYFKIKTFKLVKSKIKTYINRKTSGPFFNRIEPYFIDFFESSLDNVVRKSLLSVSARESRDFINKGYVFVNGKKLFKYSYKVKKGDLISFEPSIHNMLIKNFNLLVINSTITTLPDYIEVNYKTLQIKIFSDRINKKYLNQYPFKLEFRRLYKYLV